MEEGLNMSYEAAIESLSEEEYIRFRRKNFELLKTNPSHPSLHFKKIGKFWFTRVGINHRALAVEDDEDFVWVWIGTHDEYDRIVKEMS